jgi:tripartite-type tricarboxylate transporter receptor subunit TctC
MRRGASAGAALTGRSRGFTFLIQSCFPREIGSAMMRSSSKRSGYRIRTLLCTLAVGLVLVASACSSKSSSGSGGTAQDGVNFYKGKTITLIIPSDTGGGIDLWSRLVGAQLAKNLDATVKYENVAAGNGIVAANEIGHAANDGLTIGVINLSTVLQQMVKAGSASSTGAGLTYDWTKLGWITAKESASDVVAVNSDTPFKTFEQLLNPPRQIKVLSVTSGVASLYTNMVVQGYALDAKTITGYEATADLVTGLLRGDGDMIVGQISGSLGGAIREGKVRALALTSPDSPDDSTYSYVKNVPTFQQLLTSNPPPTASDKQKFEDALSFISLVNGLAAPAGVPSNRLAALVAAVKQAYAGAAFQKQLATNAIPTDYVAPAQVGQFVASGYSNGVKLKDWLS